MQPFDPRRHTDAPQQIRKTTLIDAPIEAVWRVVADHGGMTEWMPMITHVDESMNPDGSASGVGCRRACQFGPDLLQETIVHWDPPHGYAYRIADMHLVRDHLGYLRLERAGDQTQVTWTQYFYPNGHAVKNFIARRFMMPGVMRRALNNLSRRVA